MRQVLSLSIPAATVKKIRSLSKARGHKSVSEYIKHLVKLDEDLISEKEILRSIQRARSEYKKGETVCTKSMADLL